LQSRLEKQAFQVKDIKNVLLYLPQAAEKLQSRLEKQAFQDKKEGGKKWVSSL